MGKLGTIAKWALPIAGMATGNPWLAAAGGAAGGAMNGGGWKGALTSGALSFGGSKLLSGMGGGNNPLSGLMNMFGGGGGNGGGPSWTKQLMPQNPDPMKGFSGSVSNGKAFAVNSVAKQQSKVGGGGLMSNPLLLGGLLMGGSQLLRSPKVPELPQSVIDFQNTARSGNPLQNQAQQALMQQFSQTQQNLGQPEIDAINRQYDIAQEQELKSVDSMYKSLRPGSDPLTDSSYQKDLGMVRDRYATLRADSVAQAQRQISNDFAGQRAQQIAQASGISQQQMQQLSQLSQFDLDRQLSQLQIDYADKQALRDYLLQMGGNILMSKFQTNPLAQLFGGN